MARAKKTCPNGHENGVRAFNCKECDHKFVFKDKVVQKTEPKTYQEGGIGRVECYNCEVFYGARRSSCPKCGIAKLKKLKKPTKDKISDVAGKGYRYCSECKKYVGVRCKICPNCSANLPKLASVKKKKVDTDWPDIYLEEAQTFREKLSLIGDVPIYALAGETKKPKLTAEEVGIWAENLVYEYPQKERQYVSIHALRHQIRGHFSGKEQTKALNFLKQWEKSYD